jgi:hypothetical protein
MRQLFSGVVLLIMIPSLGIADDAQVCVPGYETKTCGNYTGCALPEWVCCPFQSGEGWQWSNPPCPSTDE